MTLTPPLGSRFWKIVLDRFVPIVITLSIDLMVSVCRMKIVSQVYIIVKYKDLRSGTDENATALFSSFTEILHSLVRGFYRLNDRTFGLCPSAPN